MMVDEYAYTGLLNNLKWKGCRNLWVHAGCGVSRHVPRGFQTVGVPGVLLDNRLAARGATLPSTEEMDSLIRGLVDDQGDADEYHPLYIIDYANMPEFGAIAYQVALDCQAAWTINHHSYGWIAFDTLPGLFTWLSDD